MIELLQQKKVLFWNIAPELVNANIVQSRLFYWYFFCYIKIEENRLSSIACLIYTLKYRLLISNSLIIDGITQSGYNILSNVFVLISTHALISTYRVFFYLWISMILSIFK